MSEVARILSYVHGVLWYPKVKRVVLMVLALLAVDLVLAAFFWGPAALRHRGLVRGIEDHNRAKRDALEAQRTAENYGALSRRAGELEVKWKSPANQSDLIRSLTQLAGKSGLTVVSQDFDAADSKGGPVFKQNLSLSGPYAGLRRFLSGLENLPSLTVVEQARIERSGEEGSRLRAVLQLSTYHKAAGHGP